MPQRSIRPTFRHVLGAAGLLAVTFLQHVAQAQVATSECYFDQGRMVDAQVLGGTKRETQEATGNLHYLLSLPKGHDKNKKWPVVVFMHGIGEVNPKGDTLNALTKHSLPRLVEDPMFNYPFIVISPQIASDGWVNHAAEIGAVLDRVETEFGGDKNREYLTGLSYGGVGTLAVGIELASRIAALMPVTPGGSVSNWADRAKIANKPIWLFNGSTDKEYATNQQRAKELEMSGGAAFYGYAYAFADEYKDAVPKAALAAKHVFGTYTDIGHDVWHAAYGVYCPTLDAQKTVQYDWLLAQSLDGSPFTDPRDPNAGTGASNMGGAAAGGAAGMAGAGTGGTPSGGAPTPQGGMAPAGTSGASTSAGESAESGGSGGGSGNAGSGSNLLPSNPGSADDAHDSSGCSLAPSASRSASVLGLLLVGAALLRRRAR